MNKIAACPFLLLVEDARHHMTSRPCNKPAMSGFCREHAYCAELLDAARDAGYPRFVVAVDRNGEATYSIGAGQENWQGYALRHRRERHSEMVRRLHGLAKQAA